MKKVVNRLLILIIILSIIIPIKKVFAEPKTLRDYKNGIAALEQKKATNQRLSAEAAAAIEAKRNAIDEANNTIEANEQTVEESKTKVIESEEQIRIKTDELKDVINIMQYTEMNQDEIYIDYVFSASSIPDMMQRQSVVEQIATYTQDELNSLEKLVQENKDLQVKLEQDNVILNNSISNYEKQAIELRNYIDSLETIGMGVEEELASQKKLVKAFEDAGCKLDDDVQDCYYNRGGNSTSFSRPLVSGVISQGWSASHGGMDLAVPKGTAVYASANGTVAAIQDGPAFLRAHGYKSCGGNIIYIHHIVNGVKYTTEYAHLTSYNVKVGQFVTKSTLIGTTGGDKTTRYYDQCTFGPHLHYSIGTGWYPSSGYYKSTYNKNTYPTGNASISGLQSRYGWSWNTR